MRSIWKHVAWLLLVISQLNSGVAQSQTNPPVAPAPAVPEPAGNRLTLQQCIELALQNNISVKQGQLTVDNADLQLRQARFNPFPTLNFSGNQSLSNGRVVDPFTNTASNQQITSSNYQLNSGVTLYNGYALRNTIRQNDLTLQASQREVESTRNDVSINVAQNYLNVLTGQEQLIIAQRQADVTQAQLDRTQRLVNAGTLPEGNLYDLRAQLAQNEVDIVNAQNNLDLAKLALLQTMNVPIDLSVTVEPVNVPDPTVSPYPASVQQIYEIALAFLSNIQGADLRIRSAALGVEVAKGSLYPTLAVNGNLSTFYSSAARNRTTLTGQFSSAPSQQYFITGLDGSQIPVFQNVPQTTLTRFNYPSQLQNNFNQSVSLILRVPIFVGFQSRNRITSARIQQRDAELRADNIRLQLRQQIETAYTNLRASANRYVATRAQVTSLEQAFRIAEIRFNAGAVNSVDYSIAKTNLDRTRASLVQAKYDYVFRTKILDFYQNKPLTF